MSTRKDVPLSKLLLNTKNPRIVECETQEECISQIYECGKNGFETLLNSILKRGFMQGESILVTPAADGSGKYIVEEGNRRISALKLLHGTKSVCGKNTDLKRLLEYSKKFNPLFKERSKKVHCLIFHENEYEELVKEIAIRHMSHVAPKDDWPPLRKARFAKQNFGIDSPELELLERYFYIHPECDKFWSPVYPLTYLTDFIRPLAQHLGYENAWALAKSYPDRASQQVIDKLIEDIKRVVVDKSGEGPIDITVLENRRKNAYTFLNENYKKGEEPVDPTPKPSPYKERHTPTVTPQPKNAVSAKGNSRKVNPNQEHAQEIIKLSGRIANSKLQTLAKENLTMMNAKLNVPFAKSMILRTLLDVVAQCLCKAHGVTPAGKRPMLGEYLECITKEKLINDARIAGLISQVKQKNLESMNVIVHGQDWTPTDIDVDGNYSNVLPLIKGMLIEVIERKNKPSVASVNQK